MIQCRDQEEMVMDERSVQSWQCGSSAAQKGRTEGHEGQPQLVSLSERKIKRKRQ